MFAQLRQLLRLIGKRQRRHGAWLLIAILLGACLEVVGVAAVPAFIGALVDPEGLRRLGVFDGLIDWLSSADMMTTMLYGSAALIAVFAVKTVFLMMNFHLQVRYVSRVRVDLATRLTRSYLRAPYSFHLERNTSELLRNVDREAGIIAYSVLGALLEVCTRFVILIAVLAFLFVAEPWVTVYWFLLFGVIGVLGTWLVGAKLKHQGLTEQSARKAFLQSLHQGFGTVKEARVLNREGFFEDRIGDAVRTITGAMQFKLVSGKVIAPVTEFIAVTGLLVLGTTLLAVGRSPDDVLVTLSLFVIGLVRLRETLNASLFHLASLRYNLVSITPVAEDIERLEAAAGTGDRGVPAPPRERLLRREVALADVWHRYPGSRDFAVRGVELTIPKGDLVGFVGSTGAGKSTLIDVMLGLLRPERGRVLVDGKDVHEGDLGAWQRSIGYVPQSIYLLDDTVRRNIALGVPDDEIDETALWRAVQRAQLEPFLKRQPEGLDTVIGERGMRISGGERQRIGIARALYHDPEVLILDEATSALDNETERAVVEAVRSARGELTIVMIAHRLSTVRDCTTLYYMKEGRVAARGSFAELQAESDEFRSMSMPGSPTDACA